MKLLTFYTESHKPLFCEMFIPSVETQDFASLHAGSGTQYSKDGGYYSEGFNETCRDKMLFILEKLEFLPDDFLLFSDCDVVFLKPVTKYLKGYEDYDMVFQNGYPELNTGFFMMRNCDEVKALLRDVIKNCHIYHDDQDALNHRIKNHGVKYGMFDNRIVCPATFNKSVIWKDEIFKIPEETIAFHACWCVGVKDKMKLLRQIVETQNLASLP
jgi:hypothetical protein